MARVNVYYDKEEKEQFFMVRGDEAYARATKTELSLGSVTNETALSFDMELSFNVLRDYGDGSVVIYDNDVPVYVTNNWNGLSDETTITLTGLTYDVQHNFYARYIGNNQSNSSKSNILPFTLPNTHKANSTLTIDATTRQYNINGSLTKTITLTNNSSDSGASDYNKHQSISIYYDDEFISTESTYTGNTVSFTVSNLTSGLHTIKAVYAGSATLNSRTVTQTISVGYNVLIKNYPLAIVKGSEYTYKATVEDWLGNPVNTTVTLYGHETATSEGISRGSATSTNGVATITSSTIEEGYISFGVTSNGVNYTSEVIDINYVNPTQITAYAPTRLFKGENSVVRFKLNVAKPYIPIELSGYVNETLTTNGSGEASKKVVGLGDGIEKTITASSGETSISVRFTDYNMYWEAGDVHNMDYALANGVINELNKYFRIKILGGSASGTANQFFTIPSVKNNSDYELTLEGVTTTSNCTIKYLPNAKYDGIWTINDLDTSLNNTAHSNENWRIVRSSGTVSVYFNDTLIDTFTGQGEYQPGFIIRNPNLNFMYMTFNKLTLTGGI